MTASAFEPWELLVGQPAIFLGRLSV